MVIEVGGWIPQSFERNINHKLQAEILALTYAAINNVFLFAI